MSDDMPEQHKTVEITPPGPVEIAIARMDAKLDKRLDSQDTKLDTLVSGGIETNVRLDRVETRLTGAEARVDILEGRAGSTSLRVQGTSQMTLESAAQLGQERAAREALDAKVDKLDQILKAQSDFMGMGKRGAEWLASKEGRTAMAQLGAAIVVVYEALKHGGVVK